MCFLKIIPHVSQKTSTQTSPKNPTLKISPVTPLTRPMPNPSPTETDSTPRPPHFVAHSRGDKLKGVGEEPWQERNSTQTKQTKRANYSRTSSWKKLRKGCSKNDRSTYSTHYHKHQIDSSLHIRLFVSQKRRICPSNRFLFSLRSIQKI